TNVEAPVRCALEITKELQKYPGSKEKPQLRLRMGIHSGPVNEVTDLNEQANIAGAGINVAQRVMDCGDAGHILISKRVADDLEQYPQWRPHLHSLGECEVKHGLHLHIFNLCGENFGNAAVPAKISTRRTTPQQWPNQFLVRAATGLLIAALLILSAIFMFRSHRAVTATSRS